MKEIMQLCDVIRETGFAIHRYGELWRCEIPDKEIHPHRHEPRFLILCLLCFFAAKEQL